MSSLSDLKDGLGTSTGKLILLTVVTAGLYPLVWLAQTTRYLRDVTKTSVVNDLFPIGMLACAGWASVLASVHDRDVNAVGPVLSVGLAVLYIVWAFKAKKVIEEYAVNQHRVDPKINSAYTFFLNIFYICYCINDLPNEQRKQQTLNGQP